MSASPSVGFPAAHDLILIAVAAGAERYALARAFRGKLVPTESTLARLDGRPASDTVSPASGEAQTALDL